ncbi:hypothetical protein BDV96DRAFT_592969 [Lophiotrema nucula]|uniref:Uncharacterized protein n=1 Tax=Lophiotrema nucula TaxID=690887 RepID=A0A6A5ZVY9_9PLEO|nr:hypothetical protein BDV96DRAFT_592969 [Lophiotrema nucula]
MKFTAAIFYAVALIEVAHAMPAPNGKLDIDYKKRGSPSTEATFRKDYIDLSEAGVDMKKRDLTEAGLDKKKRNDHPEEATFNFEYIDLSEAGEDVEKRELSESGEDEE